MKRRPASGSAASWSSRSSTVRRRAAHPKARSRSAGARPGPAAGAAEEGGLELLLAAVEEGHQQAGTVTEAAEDGALADTGRGGDLLHGDGVGAARRDETGGRLQQPGPVARGVGAQAGLVVETELQQLRGLDGLLGVGAEGGTADMKPA